MIRLRRTLGSVPDNLRLYAIGDIHGRVDLLMRLLDMVVDDNESRQHVERRVLIFLGDYIDRGPDSCRVIDVLINELPKGFSTIFLKGNHEAMMLEAMENEQALPTWFHNGGSSTLYSYGINPDKYILKPDATKVLGKLLNENMPRNHKKFFSSLRMNATFGDYFFVHAGVNPAVALQEQKEIDMLWIRQRFLRYRGKMDKIIVHGHTITPSPEVESNRIGIDTGAWRSGKLTAVCLQERDYVFLST